MEHRTDLRNAPTSFVHMHKHFLERAREMSCELHEYGGLVLNAQQRVRAHCFERDGVAFRSAIPKPEDIGHVAASNFRIFSVKKFNAIEQNR